MKQNAEVDHLSHTHTPLHVTSSADIKGKGSPYSTAERRVPGLIRVLGSQPFDVTQIPFVADLLQTRCELNVYFPM